MKLDTREGTSRSHWLLLQRRGANTELELARIEAQPLAVWGSTTSRNCDAQSVWPTLADPGEPGVALASSSLQRTRGPWCGDTTLIADAYRALLDSASWYSIGSTLLQEPFCTSASVTIGVIRPPESAMVVPSDVSTPAIGPLNWFATRSSLSPVNAAPARETVSVDRGTVDRRSVSRSGRVRDIYVLGYPLLRQRLASVPDVDESVRRFVDDLFETMRAYGGVGLAANQVGDSRRIAVVDVGDDDPPALVLVNPRIIDRSDDVETSEEGCLSIPDIYGDVERPVWVVLEALDRDGQPYRLRLSNFKARAVQHEIDHLDGIFFLDHLSAVKRGLLMAKWRKSWKKKPGYIREPPDKS